MSGSDVTEAVLAHRALLSTDNVWLEVHEGRLSADEARVGLRHVESDELAERSKAIFERRFSARDEAQFEEVSRLYRGSVTTRPTQEATNWWFSLSLAAAVLLFLWFAVTPSHDDTPLGTRYALELRRDFAPMRSSGDAAQAHVYRADRSIEIWLRPMQTVEGPIGVVVAARSGATTKILPVAPTIEKNGVVHIVADVATLGLAPGKWDLYFVVGRKGTLAEGVENRLTDAPPDDGFSYVVLSARIRILAAPGTG